MSCPLGPAVQAPVLRAWTAAPALPGRLMGTCRDLLRAGTGEREDGFEGKVVSEVSGGEAGRKDDPGGRNSPVNLLFRGSGRSGRGSQVQVHAQAQTLPHGGCRWSQWT